MLLKILTLILFDIYLFSLVGTDIELDAVGREFESYLTVAYSRMRLRAGGALVVWPVMLFRTVVVNKSTT